MNKIIYSTIGIVFSVLVLFYLVGWNNLFIKSEWISIDLQTRNMNKGFGYVIKDNVFNVDSDIIFLIYRPCMVINHKLNNRIEEIDKIYINSRIDLCNIDSSFDMALYDFKKIDYLTCYSSLSGMSNSKMYKIAQKQDE